MEEVSLLNYCEQKGKTNLIRQWSVPENREFDPEKTGFASHKKIWWVCEKGHKWQAMISDRVKKDAGWLLMAVTGVSGGSVSWTMSGKRRWGTGRRKGMNVLTAPGKKRGQDLMIW